MISDTDNIDEYIKIKLITLKAIKYIAHGFFRRFFLSKNNQTKYATYTTYKYKNWTTKLI